MREFLAGARGKGGVDRLASPCLALEPPFPQQKCEGSGGPNQV